MGSRFAEVYELDNLSRSSLWICPLYFNGWLRFSNLHTFTSAYVHKIFRMIIGFQFFIHAAKFEIYGIYFLLQFGQQTFDTIGMEFGSQATREFSRGSSPEWLHMQVGGGFDRTS